VSVDPSTDQAPVNTTAPAANGAAGASSGWSAGTETATDNSAPPADARQSQAEPEQPRSPAEFEARIREVLRAQQNSRQQ
jgi:hypothetical protein